MDKWILSRLSDTVSWCETGFRNLDLTSVTTALFNFWLYDLCDYYIEYLKPSFYSKEEKTSESRNSLEILYTCLDVGLRLISPFMPYISEELFQRLPRRQPDTDAPSICVTPYPLPDEFNIFRNVEIENQVKIAQEAINKIRSLRADYQLTPKVKTELFIHSLDKDIQTALENLLDLIITMTNAKSALCLNDSSQVPHGCAFSTLSDKCKLFILLKGIIDIDKEELKSNKKKDALNKQISTLRKDMSSENYEVRVPEPVRVKNQEKLVQLENEIQLIDDGLKQLQLMRA
jgi:valyl-tRNA synthetase